MNSRGRVLRRMSLAAACIAALATVPAAMAQSVPPTGIGPVDTVVGSFSGGIEKPHEYVCDENNPVVDNIVSGVKKSLTVSFPDITTMAARGYFPYVDAFLFGYSGRQGHWINPKFIGDVYPEGHPKAGKPILMDPDYPESILVDRWNRPIGVMFIADDPYVPGPDMYVDEETKVPCNGWHYHTETLADAYWYAYKYLYSGDTLEGDINPPDRTPDLMHVWRYGPYSQQWNHNAPDQKYMPGDPDSYDEVKDAIGGPRLPIPPPVG